MRAMQKKRVRPTWTGVFRVFMGCFLCFGFLSLVSLVFTEVLEKIWREVTRKVWGTPDYAGRCSAEKLRGFMAAYLCKVLETADRREADRTWDRDEAAQE